MREARNDTNGFKIRSLSEVEVPTLVSHNKDLQSKKSDCRFKITDQRLQIWGFLQDQKPAYRLPGRQTGAQSGSVINLKSSIKKVIDDL